NRRGADGILSVIVAFNLEAGTGSTFLTVRLLTWRSDFVDWWPLKYEEVSSLIIPPIRVHPRKSAAYCRESQILRDWLQGSS
ncbi:MAG: hypothetical protein ACRD8U_25390, partial [Pyrinomonadaceae bacterium]